ncbi:hypothetical protein TeGR_g2644, partial [Tetraparma gracilis]
YVNFQTPQNSLITLFSLLMVNNWHVIHDAVEVSLTRRFPNPTPGLVDAYPWLVSVYFVTFHIVAVIVVMNLLVSIFLDRYLTEWQKAKFQDVSRVKKFRKLASSASFSSTRDSEGSAAGDSEGEDLDEIYTTAHGRNFRKLDVESVLVCHSCESELHWLSNPAVECELSHKICCRRCCCTYIEPRIDADLDFFPDAEASKAAASSPQTQRVGFEPIKIENGVREMLIRVWEENELLLSQAGDASELDNDGVSFIEMKEEAAPTPKQKKPALVVDTTVSNPTRGDASTRTPHTNTNRKKLELERDVDELISREADEDGNIGKEDKEKLEQFEYELDGVMGEGTDGAGAAGGKRRKSRLSEAVQMEQRREVRRSMNQPR